MRGKPLNSYGLRKKIVYENEEFNLLQHALNIEDGIEGLRYNNIVIATDADVDGMHIRLLLMILIYLILNYSKNFQWSMEHWFEQLDEKKH